jgi:predicted Zn-dependent protease
LEKRPLRMVFVGLVLAFPLTLCTLHTASYWKDNLTLLTHVHEIAPENMFVRNDLAVEWLDRGQSEKAKELLEPLVREHPENWLAWANLGRVDYRTGDYADAETSLRRALELNPGSAAAYTVLGQVELRTNRPGEALASEGRAVELLPLEYRFHTIYGVTFEATGDCRSAIAQFETALALHPGDEISQQQMELCRASLRSSNDASPAIPAR